MHEEKDVRVARLCDALNVKRSTYYAWDKRPESKRSIRKRELTKKVKHEFFSNHKIPGAKKIGKSLNVDRKTVGKIMREHGWKSKVVKKYKATTNSKHNLPVAENILKRDFKTLYHNQKWVTT